jgi:hypothetical protein
MEEFVEQFMETDMVHLRLHEDVRFHAGLRKKPYIQVSVQDILWFTMEKHPH